MKLKTESDVRKWAVVFKIFGNENRVKVVRILNRKDLMTVGKIAEKLNISFNATSNHLTLLQKLDILNSVGKNNHVYYSINPNMPENFRRIVNLFTKS